MELDIQNLSNNAARMETVRRNSEVAQAIKAKAKAQRIAEEQSKKEAAAAPISEKDAEGYLKDILRMTSLFDRKLKFILNRDLGTIVVKVVDRQTDKVIKEIPPEELQRLHRRMKEAIGLLIDEEI
ncbi:flagellar protein FlaG [Sediminispirochaeta bajacaliforniensis]|uniref:flagellar protein FlaG n=1 Tax=Sediminispirochaeta bajacaliforniensis TaxID=148 RepID=UPI000367B134|nr:flagellar protein FlaG [Sediminispirochaeta bajacaliforniensis]